MGVKKLVSFGWAAGGVVEISCGTIIIVSGSENHEKYMGVKKLLVLGGWLVGWRKSVVGPSSLCLAQKIMKNDVSYMGVKKLLVLGGWWVGWGGGSQLQDLHHCDGLKKL